MHLVACLGDSLLILLHLIRLSIILDFLSIERKNDNNIVFTDIKTAANCCNQLNSRVLKFMFILSNELIYLNLVCIVVRDVWIIVK